MVAARSVATMIVAVANEVSVVRALTAVQHANDLSICFLPPVARGGSLRAGEGIDAFPVTSPCAPHAVMSSVLEDSPNALLLTPVETERAVESANVAVGVARDLPPHGPIHDDALGARRRAARVALVALCSLKWDAAGRHQAESEYDEEGTAMSRG